MCFSQGRKRRMNERKDGQRKDMISCPDFEPGTPRTPITGPVDASHTG